MIQVILGCLTLTAAWLMPCHAQNAVLFDTPLEDQFGKPFIKEDHARQIVVILGSDRDGEKYNRLWGPAIKDSLKEHPRFGRIVFFGLADAKGAPFFVHGMIKRSFPKDQRVLIDWKGNVVPSMEFKKGYSNIFIFAPGGAQVYRVNVTEVTADVLADILAVIRGLLSVKPPLVH